MQSKTFAGKFFRSAVFSLSLILAGCSSGVTGKWINPQDPKDYYEFKSNGTWFAEDSSGKHETGTYTVDYDQITLKKADGTLVKVTNKDKVLTAADGKTYQPQ